MKSGNLSSGRKRLNYVADFETTTSPDDCRVWLWGLIPVQENVEFEDMDYGISIDTFADRLNKDNTIVHFPGGKELIGKIVKVYLEESKGFYYMGSLVD